MKGIFTLLFSTCLFCYTIQAQVLDHTFGTGGLVINNLTQGIDGIYGIALQNDGKIIASGTANNRFILIRYNTNGTFDSSFGNNGIIQTNFSFGGGFTKIIIQPDDKIIVNASNNFRPFIARYNPDGTPDHTFGNNGIRYFVIHEIDNSTIYSMVLSKENKIILVGKKHGNISNPPYIYLMRLNQDGSTDTDFGTEGSTGLSLLSPDITYAKGITINATPQDIGVNSHGEIFVQINFSIKTEEGYLSDYGVLKYTASGVWDNTFGEEGIAAANIHHPGQILPSNFKILDDGKIISIARKNYNPLPKRGLLITKYNTDGSIDTDFGNNGLVETIVTNSKKTDLDILSNGKIFIAGDNLETFTSILYHPDGQIDTDYGEDGFFVYKFEPGSYDFGRVIAKQPDGKIIIGGSTSHQCANTGFALMRLNVENDILLRLNTESKTPVEKTVDLQLFPNPTQGKTTITFPKELSEINVKILNITGQEISNYYFKNTSKIDLDLEVKNGLYFIHIIQNNNIIANFKVIKQE